MSDHTIRLRAGWRSWPEGADESGAERIDLPSARIHDRDGPLCLLRSFQRPPLEPGRERLELRLDSVPGLAAVCLNSQVLAAFAADPTGPVLLPLPEALPTRNHLVLRLGPPGPRKGAATRPPWGEIALVIRSEGPALAEA
jgi:hypothetical protein